MATVITTDFHIPGDVVATRQTSAANAWLGEYMTIVLQGELAAMRVHVNAGEGAARQKHLVSGAGLIGKWYAIGDFIQTFDEYVTTHALPAHFTHAALFSFLPGTVLNVGRCAPLFGRPGGAEQAEYLEGPTPRYRKIDGFWSPFAGHA